jgi:hypothetical protein
LARGQFIWDNGINGGIDWRHAWTNESVNSFDALTNDKDEKRELAIIRQFRRAIMMALL